MGSFANVFELLSAPRHGKPLGIYYEAQSQVRGYVTSIGMVIDRGSIPQGRVVNDPSRPIEIDYPYPLMPNVSRFGIHLSTALLCEIRTIELCVRDGNCTGLIVSYADHSTIVLGKWHESQTAVSSTIFDSQACEEFVKVEFTILQQKDHNVVRGIRVSPSLPSATTGFDERVNGTVKEYFLGVSIACNHTYQKGLTSTLCLGHYSLAIF